ncbi:ribonuclease H-like domain-containing protein [Tanacetum coccineum]
MIFGCLQADLQADVVGAVPIPSDAAGNSLMQKATRGVKQGLQGIRMQRQNVRPLLCQLTELGEARKACSVVVVDKLALLHTKLLNYLRIYGVNLLMQSTSLKNHFQKIEYGGSGAGAIFVAAAQFPKEVKVDFDMTELHRTLFKMYQVILLMATTLYVQIPKPKKVDAWTYIEAIFQDNKRPRAMALKAELHNLKLGDLSIDGYFQKIESIVLVLDGLGSPLSNDYVVTFALEGLPSTYETISTVIVSREPFPDLKTVKSLLTTHEMRLKSRVQNPLVDATFVSLMVLLAKSNTSARRGPSLEKVNNLCWSFAKGSCRFGDACKYLHNGVHGKSTLLPRTSGSASSVPVAYTVSVPPGFQSVSAQLSAHPTYVSPQLLPGSFGVSNMGMAGLFPQGVQYPTGSPQQGVHYPQQGVQTLSGPPQGVHLVPGTSQPPVQFTTGVQQQQGGSFPGSVHLGQSPSMPFHPSQLFASGSQGSGQATLLPNAFNTTTLQEPASGNWNMDTGASSHLNDSVHCLSDILNMCIYPSVAVGDGRFIPVTNSGHSVLSTPFRPLRLNNVLITPNIVKNLISVRQFVRDNSCTVEFDPFGFSVKDFITRRVLLRCDSTGELYPVTKPSTIPHAFLTSQYTWHQRLGHPGSEVLRRLVSSDSISCNKEKLPVLCHACQLGKHVKLPFVSSSSSVTSCFDIVHSDLWTSPIPSLSGFQYYCEIKSF